MNFTLLVRFQNRVKRLVKLKKSQVLKNAHGTTIVTKAQEEIHSEVHVLNRIAVGVEDETQTLVPKGKAIPVNVEIDTILSSKSLSSLSTLPSRFEGVFTRALHQISN